ncbi:MAG: thermonuclease family protein [Pacificimonas sp.]
MEVPTISLLLTAALVGGGLGAVFAPDDGDASYEAHSRTFSCSVTHVYDGDGPIYCAEGAKVRLTAIAARELNEGCRPGHPCPDASGAHARDGLRALADGQRLNCEATGESYGRITAWCHRSDGVELNCAMVRKGLALHWQRYDPDGRLCTT